MSVYKIQTLKNGIENEATVSSGDLAKELAADYKARGYKVKVTRLVIA